MTNPEWIWLFGFIRQTWLTQNTDRTSTVDDKTSAPINVPIDWKSVSSIVKVHSHCRGLYNHRNSQASPANPSWNASIMP